MGMIEVIGHRGAAGLEPENTLRSVRRAIELGVDRVEIDVRVSRDERLVIMHDETVDRTTNGHGYVSELTFDELRSLDAGMGEKIPTLDEILKFTMGKAKLEIELKVPEATEPTIQLIEELNAEKDVIVISFIHELLERVHDLNPNIKTGALFFEVPKDILQRALKAHASSIHVYYRNVNSELVKEAHRSGLEVAVWNPNRIEEMREMIDLGVDAIGSDRPDRLIQLLRDMGMR
ncbi:glycerophosphoryl diester phosphodiesterase [Candidatus Bathyarchaeota archaeon]|nr:MAG: glycerophosphoryl diester phosphodiesterase [Candidatus Bathyarchaeota archaeon]